jgi:hypothetical protein
MGNPESLTFIYLVYPVLPVSLDYPFLVALSVVFACVPKVVMGNPETLATLGTQDKYTSETTDRATKNG